tara:strand:+ start:444 stop:581 length:138 start_codon:yes stop_codon:yes gene_type:complete
MSIHKKLKALKKANELEAQIKNDIRILNERLKEVQSIQSRIKGEA